jgi:hypothetical protein
MMSEFDGPAMQGVTQRKNGHRLINLFDTMSSFD